MAYVIKLKNDIKLDNEIKEFLAPKYIFIPIKNKKTDKLLVSDNSYVYKNDLVVDGEEKHFSSISGRVLGVQDMMFADGSFTSIVIENDFKESIRKRHGSKKRLTDYSKLDGLKMLTSCGINLKKINYESSTLIINALDLEPFFGNNYYILSKYAKQLISGSVAIFNFLNFTKLYFVLDNKDTELIGKYKDLCKPYPFIELITLENYYPVANNELIKEKLNEDDAAILSTREVYDIYYALKRQSPKNEMLITITGNAVKNANVMFVKKYSLLSEAFLEDNDFTSIKVDVYLNGLLSGHIVNTLRYVIDDNINGIIVNEKIEKKQTKCSECGLCTNYCPRGIDIKNLLRQGEEAQNYIKEKCINCGICNFVCPSNIDLKKYTNYPL